MGRAREILYFVETYEASIEPQYCPACRGILRHITNLADEQAIEEGDYVICQHCGSFLIMGKDFSFTEVADSVVRNDQRFHPKSIDQIFVARDAVRAKGGLLVTQGPEGRTMTALPPRPDVQWRKDKE